VDCQGNEHGEELTKEMVLLKIKELEERLVEVNRSNEEFQKAKNAAYHDISGANMTLSNVEKEEKELKKDKKQNMKKLKEKTQEYTKISNERGNSITELENNDARLNYGKYQVEMINQTLDRLKTILKYFNGELDESAATEMIAMMDSEEPKKKKKRRKKRKKRKRKSRKVREEAASAAAEQKKKELRAKLREKIKGCRNK
jgi:chromosome segregation ATPase